MPPETPPTDQSLLDLLRTGDPTAAASLYARYVERLRAVARAGCSPDLARRVEADDLVQSVFRSFFRRASEGLYDVPEGGDLWNLFLVIAQNKIRRQGKFHRAAKRDIRRSLDGVELDQLPRPGRGGGSDDIELTELRLVLTQALEPLDPTRRRVVELRILGHEIAEIALAVERSKRTVERILQDFRDSFRELIREPDEPVRTTLGLVAEPLTDPEPAAPTQETP